MDGEHSLRYCTFCGFRKSYHIPTTELLGGLLHTIWAVGSQRVMIDVVLRRPFDGVQSVVIMSLSLDFYRATHCMHMCGISVCPSYFMRPDSPRDFGAVYYLLTYLLTYLCINLCRTDRADFSNGLYPIHDARKNLKRRAIRNTNT